MEQYIPVMKRALIMAEDCLATLEQILVRMAEISGDELIGLFGDLKELFSAIEHSIQYFIDDLPSNQIEEKMLQMQMVLERIIWTHNQHEYHKICETVRMYLLPVCDKWNQELRKAFSAYIVS